VKALHPSSLLFFTPALTADNTEYVRRLRLGLRQIASLTNSEKSMVYFSRNCSSPQGAEATSHIQETLSAISANAFLKKNNLPSMTDEEDFNATKFAGSRNRIKNSK